MVTFSGNGIEIVDTWCNERLAYLSPGLADGLPSLMVRYVSNDLSAVLNSRYLFLC